MTKIAIMQVSISLVFFCLFRYELLHLHPLQSRVVDMERKLKIAMDTLVKRVKAATSRRPAPSTVIVW